MTRGRGDPLRIFAGQRAGLFMRLTSEGGLSASSADRWLDVWVEKARTERGVSRTSDSCGWRLRIAGREGANWDAICYSRHRVDSWIGAADS